MMLYRPHMKVMWWSGFRLDYEIAGNLFRVKTPLCKTLNPSEHQLPHLKTRLLLPGPWCCFRVKWDDAPKEVITVSHRQWARSKWETQLLWIRWIVVFWFHLRQDLNLKDTRLFYFGRAIANQVTHAIVNKVAYADNPLNWRRQLPPPVTPVVCGRTVSQVHS